MRKEALDYLACPDCKASLDLAEGATTAPDGHVIEGSLVCRIRGCRYSVRHGVPALVHPFVEPAAADTAARFDTQWKHWRQLDDLYERQFLDWIAPVGREQFVDRLVLEGGCGKGRHSVVVSGFGPRALVSVDLGESSYVAFENTRHLPNVHIVQGDLLKPPVGPVFDLAFSVGVLHHLPDPTAGFRSLASRLRDGGRVVAWVYGRENNEWITQFVDPVRKALTSRLPPKALRALSALPAAGIWSAIKTLYDHGPRPVRERLPYAQYFESLSGFPFREIHNIVFDQLVTPIAYYLSEADVRAWVAEGFRDVVVRWKGEYSWTVTGTVSREAAAPLFDPSDSRVIPMENS